MADIKTPESKILGKYICNLDEDACEMEFDCKGKLILTRDGNFTLEATYKIIDDKIEFVDIQGPKANPESGKGVYRWEKDGDKIVFTVIDDIGMGRKRYLTSQPHLLIKSFED